MFPYLKLLIRQRIAAWNPINLQYARKSKASGIFAYVGFCLVALMLYAMLVGMEYLLYGAFAQLGEPQTMLALTGILCTMLTIITGFFYIFNELFFSKDVALVSALPISSRGLLTAKLIRIWLSEAGIALAVCLPVIILYGVGQAQGVLYYVKALLLVPLMPLVPIAVVTLLSFLLIRVSALWKRREALTVVMSMLFLGAFMWADMRFSMSSSSAKGEMGAFMLQLVLRQKHVFDMIAGLYPPIHWFNGALTLHGFASLWQWLAFAALNIGALAAVIGVLGGAYQRLAIKQTEALARLNASTKTRVDRHGMRTPLKALYRRELHEIFIVPIYAMNSLASAVMFPIIAVAMIASAGSNAPELAMLPVMLTLVPKALIAAIATALFAFTTSMNMAVSTAVSREGKRHEFFRTLPVKPQVQLLAKLLMGLTINLICALPMALVAFFVLPACRVQIIVGFVAALCFSTATAVVALMIDVNHPKFSWKSETEAIKQNGMAALSMFGAMGFIAICGGAYFGLTVLGVSLTVALIILCTAVLVADVLLIRRLLGSTAKHYILQEVRN